MASVDYAWSIELGQELTASEAHEKWFMGILSDKTIPKYRKTTQILFDIFLSIKFSTGISFEISPLTNRSSKKFPPIIVTKNNSRKLQFKIVLSLPIEFTMAGIPNIIKIRRNGEKA